MSQPILKAGSEGPVITGGELHRSDRDSRTVIYEGPYAALEEFDLEIAGSDDLTSVIPEGYTLESRKLVPEGVGFGRLILNLIRFDDPNDTNPTPIRETVSVDMAEVQYDLEDHPALADARADILAWLATDENIRIKDGKYFKLDPNADSPVEIDDALALKFIAAYLSGIKTFNRYFPVIEKVSIWRNPPGLNRVGRSFTSGSPEFSDSIGHFDTPPISLSGFDNANYFKSKDSWHQNENKTWSRTEQWTYTPEGSTGQHAWIYEAENKD